jgi:putative ABC transport system substrate-binding protein
MKGKKFSQNKIGTRWIILTLAVVLAMLLSDCCPEKPKVYKVGILVGVEYTSPAADGFKEEMTELGYIEGENITYDIQVTNFDAETYQTILQQFVADEVDLIYAFPAQAAVVAKTVAEGTDIPVLFAVANIENTGLVNSVREPGGNITGVRYPGPDIALKRFEIMHEIVPQATRMWIPYQRTSPMVPAQLEVLYPAAEAAGVTLIEAPADDAAGLEADLQARAQSGDDIGLDAILCIPEALSVTSEAFLVMAKFADEHEIPIGGATMEVEGHASIFGVTINMRDVGRLSAPMANKILKGTPAGTIPVVSPENYIEINYKATQELGLTVSESLLSQADKVNR